MASNSGTDFIKTEDESDDGVYIRPTKKKVFVIFDYNQEFINTINLIFCR